MIPSLYPPPFSQVWAGYKYIACLILCLQNATLVLVMRHTRTRSGDMYISTTVVVMTELVKTLVCLFLVFKDEAYSVRGWLRHLHENIVQVIKSDDDFSRISQW